jgi:hypothetical protein
LSSVSPPSFRNWRRRSSTAGLDPDLRFDDPALGFRDPPVGFGAVAILLGERPAGEAL